MEFHRVSFAMINVLSEHVGEVIVDAEVNINLKMIEEMHHKLTYIFTGTFSLLINKSNSYSSELDALIKLGQLASMEKISIFAPNKMAKLSADFHADIPSSAELTIQVFTSREKAYKWLENSYISSSLVTVQCDID